MNRFKLFVSKHEVAITAVTAITLTLVVASRHRNDVYAEAMWRFIKEKGLLEEFSHRTDLVK